MYTHMNMVGVIPTGALRLDLALGIGGIPRGAITEISGPEASGKTTLCQHIITEAQKQGGVCAFIDGDHSLDPGYAARRGVDLERLYVCEPTCEEQALEIAETLARSGGIAVLVIDSALSLPPRVEIQAPLGHSYFETQSHLLSISLQKLSAAIHSSQTAIVLTTQARSTPKEIFHPGEVNTAGLAIKLHAWLRLELALLDTIREDKVAVGNRVQIRVRKNKFEPSFHTIVVELMYNEGVINTNEILNIGIETSIIGRSGSAYFYRDLQMGERREEAYKFLRHNPEISQEIESLIRQTLLPPSSPLV